MPDVADRILDSLKGLDSRLDRIEDRLERVEGLSARVAVLERQDHVDQDTNGRFERRLEAVETAHRIAAKVVHLESEIQEIREAVAGKASGKWTQAIESSTAANAKRLASLETDRARRDGMSKAAVVAWTMLTAAPGLVGLGLALWKLQS